jgi:ribosomal protein L11 methyltransferase
VRPDHRQERVARALLLEKRQHVLVDVVIVIVRVLLLEEVDELVELLVGDDAEGLARILDVQAVRHDVIVPEMEWVELVLPAGPLADEIAALLADDGVAAAGVEVRGEDIIVWVPAGEADAGLMELRGAAERLRRSGLDIDPAAVRARPAAPEDEWRDAWKRYFHVVRVTPRIVIVPSWERHEAAPGDVILDLDPGRAFGTGAHASTRLCLGELDELHQIRSVGRFLDVGTGSGILAIAAAKLWPASTGVAIDIDPIAVGAARENLERNRVHSVAVSDDALAGTGGRFDLVVANIQADVLETMAPALADRVSAGGTLILSGLLAHQAGPVAAVFEALGFIGEGVRTLDDDPDWSAVRLRRP